MRIAHCIHGLGLGGAQRVVKLIAEHASDGFEHFVYAGAGGVFADEVAAVAAVRIIPRRLPKLDPLWMLRLASAMRRDRIDLVHTHLFGDTLHGILAARFVAGTPVIVTLHIVSEFNTTLQRLGYRWLLPQARQLVACSDAVRRSFLHTSGFRQLHIPTVPNGVEPPAVSLDRRAARARLGCEPDVLAIGAVGRLVEQKGFSDLIAALQAVVPRVRQRVHLYVLGDGPLRDVLERQVHASGLTGAVTLAGFRADARQLLPAFDVVAASSLEEGMPMALLEAMAAGRCIVTTDVGGIGEAVRHGREALLVPAGDPAQLGTALCRVLTDRELRSRLGATAARRFRDRYTAGRMVADYERLYLRMQGREPSATVLHAVERG